MIADQHRDRVARRSASATAPGGPRRGRPRWPPGCARCARPGAGRPRRAPPLGQVQLAARCRPRRRCPRTASTARVHHAAHVDALGAQLGHPGVQPADLQQVGEQRLEPVQLVDQQLRAAAQRRAAARPRDACSTSAAIRTVVSGVRSSWLTSEVNRRCSAPNSSSWRIWRWMLSAISLYDSASRATSSSPRTGIRSSRCPSANRSATSRGLPDRAHHLPGHQAGDAGEQQQQHQPADDQRALHQVRACAARRSAGTAGRAPGRRSRCGPAARPAASGTSVPCSVERDRTCATSCPSATFSRRSGGTSSTGPADTWLAGVAAGVVQHRRGTRRPPARPGPRRRGALVSRSSALFSSPCAPLAVRVDAGQVALQQHPAGLGAGQRVGLLGLQHPSRRSGSAAPARAPAPRRWTAPAC